MPISQEVIDQLANNQPEGYGDHFNNLDQLLTAIELRRLSSECLTGSAIIFNPENGRQAFKVGPYGDIFTCHTEWI